MYLAINWCTFFVVKQFIFYITDLIIPIYKYRLKLKKKKVGADLPPTEPEKDFTLNRYKEISNYLNTYGDATIYFGLYALFGAALPIGSVLIFLQNWFKVKSVNFLFCFFASLKKMLLNYYIYIYIYHFP